MRNVLANKDPVEDAMQVASLLVMAQEMLCLENPDQTLTLSSQASSGLAFILILAEASIEALVEIALQSKELKESKQKDSAPGAE